jgi:hypothetical protein
VSAGQEDAERHLRVAHGGLDYAGGLLVVGIFVAWLAVVLVLIGWLGAGQPDPTPCPGGGAW